MNWNRADGPESDELPSFPGYDVTAELARGGMGVVYAAQDHAFGRAVAIKTLLPVFADLAEFVSHFDREARITARLPHPGIPPVHARGELADGRPFLVMKLIRGRTLSDDLRAGREANLPQLVHAFEQICQTVGFAHSLGIVHRDLKPQNVMVGAFGEVQVMDWGLAREPRAGEGGAGYSNDEDVGWFRVWSGFRAGAPETIAGSVKGTPSFMPPEQARGEWDKVDARADVFALGGILCSILTGQPPYADVTATGTLARAAAGDLGEAFDRLDASGADPDLVALCKQCLNPEYTDRPADGKAVADAVAGYRAGQEERARTAETDRAAAEAKAEESAHRADAEERARRAAEAQTAEQRKRRRVQLALAGAVGLLLAAGGAFAWWQDRQAEDAKLREARFETESERSETARIKAERETELQRTRSREAALAMLGQTETALRAVDAERAGEAMAQARTRIAEGGADDLQTRVSRDQADLDMLRKLDRLDSDRWVLTAGQLPGHGVFSRQLRRAFTDYGITPGTTPVADAVRRVNDSLVRDRVLTFLEIWLMNGANGARDPDVRAILTAADPDEFRNEARATDYHRALLSWASRGKPAPGAQPVWFAIGHGNQGELSREVREQLLLSAHQARPNDFTLLMSLALLDESRNKDASLRQAGWYRAALAVQPRGVPVWVNLGVALSDAGDRPGAIIAYKEAIRLDPKLAPAYSNLCETLRLMRDFPGAIAAGREATRLAPKQSGGHYHLGLALGDAGDRPGAIAAYREATRLDPDHLQSWASLGQALSDTGNRPGAIAAYKQVIRLNPNHVKAHVDLCDALRLTKDLPGAVAAGREAIRLDPKHATGHFNLGLALNDVGDRPGAIAAYKETTRLDPNHLQGWVNLGQALSSTGDRGGAITAYKEVIRLDPNHPQAHLHLSTLCFQQGDYKASIAAAREAIRVDPKSGDAHGLLGFGLWQTGDLPGARVAVAEAARLYPNRWGPALAKMPAPVAPAPREVKRHAPVAPAPREAKRDPTVGN